MKRSRDLGLGRVKKALEKKENPLSKFELEFIRTSCCILDINSEEVIKGIVKRALEKGGDQPKRVMASLRAQLDDLGARAENHKRPSPAPAFATRTYDDMDTPARSLAHLQLCAMGLSNTMLSGYSKGIKVARIATENAMKDFKATIERIQEACKWKGGTAEAWYARKEVIYGNLIEEAEEAL